MPSSQEPEATWAALKTATSFNIYDIPSLILLEMTSKPNAYPEPPPFNWDTNTVEIRDVLPVYPPPEPFNRPELSSPARKPTFSGNWTLTTHLIAASYLRTTPLIAEPEMPPLDTPKDERKRLLLRARTALDEIRMTSKAADAGGYPRILWNCVNRYVRKDLYAHNRTGLTLAFFHANGFPKEIFEPTLADLFVLPAANIIDEVWLWESVQHGDAALVNAGSLSGLFDGRDSARDITNFLLHFMPTSATNTPLPTHLPRVSPAETASRIKNGFTQRKFIAIGHSFSGRTSALAALICPALFSALYLVDPVILQYPVRFSASMANTDLALGALGRRTTWPSREAALALFQQSPFFAAWDPRVLAAYVECAIYSDTGGGVRLKMSGVQEAVIFSECYVENEVFARLGALDPRIALRWVMPGRPSLPGLDSFHTVQARVWVRRANATNVRIAGGGHFIPHEAPQELARDLCEFLNNILRSPRTINPHNRRANL